MVAKSTSLSVGLAACRHFTNRNNYYIKPTFLALFIQHKCSLQRIQTRFCSINPSNSENQQVFRKESYAEYVQRALKKENSKVPWFFMRLGLMFKTQFFKKADNLYPELRLLLDKSATQLYFNCVDLSLYAPLCKEFGLSDIFNSWFKLTLMHIWMLLFRLHFSLDAESYQRLQHSILTTFWADVDRRIKIIDELVYHIPHTYREMKHVHALFVQTFLEYDEGVLSDDSCLAAAIWRNFYMRETFDPVQVANVVRYMRATLAFLSEKDIDDILVQGIDKWKIAEEIKAFQDL